jgi:polynucleotide 5'-hydroxyl-kinase GRC3/NOL9
VAVGSDGDGPVVLAAAWQPALEAVLAAPLSLVIGEIDAGKTTLVSGLANALLARGLTVGIVDADLGQSEIGPPTTVGLGRVGRPLTRMGDTELVAMHFVGVTTPAAAMAGALVATRRMVDRARREHVARILVDTSGLVTGEVGRALKQSKIDLLDPDLVVALQRGRECEPILVAYGGAVRPAVLRLPALGIRRSRTQDARRRFRASALLRYFGAARSVTLDLTRVILRQPPLFTGTPIEAGELAALADSLGRALLWGERRDRDAVLVAADRLSETEVHQAARLLAAGPVVHYALPDLEGMLAGLEGRDRETLGLAVVQRLDVAGRAVTVDTPVVAAAVAAMAIARERYPG